MWDISTSLRYNGGLKTCTLTCSREKPGRPSQTKTWTTSFKNQRTILDLQRSKSKKAIGISEIPVFNYWTKKKRKSSERNNTGNNLERSERKSYKKACASHGTTFLVWLQQRSKELWAFTDFLWFSRSRTSSSQSRALSGLRRFQHRIMFDNSCISSLKFWDSGRTTPKSLSIKMRVSNIVFLSLIS